MYELYVYFLRLIRLALNYIIIEISVSPASLPYQDGIRLNEDMIVINTDTPSIKPPPGVKLATAAK